ncbi:MAG: helix-turn-helix domain-containing protein [bacterium]
MQTEILKYHTVKEVAVYMKVTTRTVSKWLKSGLPYHKVGGSVRIARIDFDKWILSHRTSSSPSTPVLLEALRGIPKRRSVPKKCRVRRATSSLL